MPKDRFLARRPEKSGVQGQIVGGVDEHEMGRKKETSPIFRSRTRFNERFNSSRLEFKRVSLAVACPVLIHVAPGVIGAAHEGTGFDVALTKFFLPNVDGRLIRITEATPPSAQIFH